MRSDEEAPERGELFESQASVASPKIFEAVGAIQVNVVERQKRIITQAGIMCAWAMAGAKKKI
jgi:hypothetical protein